MACPRYNLTKKRLKKIPEDLQLNVESEVKALLHAHRDCLRNRGKDTAAISFDVRDGYYGEAFGIMRCLQILGYGYFGSDNLHALQEKKGSGARADGMWIRNVNQEIQNLKWWFSQLSDQVLDEEGFNGDNRCEYCLDKYRKDTKSLMEKSHGMVEKAQQQRN